MEPSGECVAVHLRKSEARRVDRVGDGRIFLIIRALPPARVVAIPETIIECGCVLWSRGNSVRHVPERFHCMKFLFMHGVGIARSKAVFKPGLKQLLRSKALSVRSTRVLVGRKRRRIAHPASILQIHIAAVESLFVPMDIPVGKCRSCEQHSSGDSIKMTLLCSDNRTESEEQYSSAWNATDGRHVHLTPSPGDAT